MTLLPAGAQRRRFRRAIWILYYVGQTKQARPVARRRRAQGGSFLVADARPRRRGRFAATSASSGGSRGRSRARCGSTPSPAGATRRDASIYQIMPVGVVFPKSVDDIAAALRIAREHGVPVIARGGGTSQNGQPIGAGPRRRLAAGTSTRVKRLRPGGAHGRRSSPASCSSTSTPGSSADGLFFPVEPSTASRCTIGGMAGNNSCGARSIRYGKMVDNVLAVDALLPDGERVLVRPGRQCERRSRRLRPRAETSPTRHARRSPTGSATRSRRMFPKVQRRVGGYNLDALVAPRAEPRPSPRRLGRHARAHHRGDAEALAACRRTASWASATSPPSAPRWRRRGTSWRSGRWRSSSSTTTCWCSAPTSRSSGARSPTSRGGGRTACCSSSSPARTATRCSGDLKRLDAVHGRPRLPGRGRRGRRAGAAAAGLGGARGLPQHHDVDEGRRQAGLLHRGLRGAARAPRRLHRRRSPSCSPATARAAPGTRTPPSAACTCARSST